MILLHIMGRLVGLASGAIALSAAKGSRLHRKSGMAFVYAMLVRLLFCNVRACRCLSGYATLLDTRSYMNR
jgi:hypothetical protein